MRQFLLLASIFLSRYNVCEPSWPSIRDLKFWKMTSNSKEIMAAELIKSNRIDDARTIYQELIQSGLATYLSYANLAMIYAQRNQVKKSLLLVLKALQINQNSSDAYNTLRKSS